MITKGQIMKYLKKEYERTGFSFFSMVNLTRHFECKKSDLLPALGELRSEGKIRRRRGLNTVLIEYLKEEE